MYCSSCGIEVTQELNYCNRCGASLNQQTNLVPQIVAPPVRVTGPFIAIGATVVFSLAAIFSSADTLAVRGVNAAAIAWMVIVGLATVFGITGLLIRLLSSLLLNQSRLAGQLRPAQLKQQPLAPPLPAAQTGPMQAPVSSVTDHTTRTFDPVHRQRVK
jgi:hypothetical protein